LENLRYSPDSESGRCALQECLRYPQTAL
jgi:hypothetical protein